MNKALEIEKEARNVMEKFDLMVKHKDSSCLDPFSHEYIYMYPPPAILTTCDWNLPYPNDLASVSNSNNEIGLYVHIPYCRHICNFCHYVRFLDVSKNDRQEYIDALKTEILLLHEKANLSRCEVTQIHFGGGTPTCLDELELEDLLSFISKNFSISEGAEITFETSPETFTLSKAESLHRLNVNRISLGVQSLNDNVLAQAGRGHSAQEALKAYETARSAGFQNINIDLLYGLPGQTLESWESTLQMVISLRPEHITCFNLRIKPETSFVPEKHLNALPKKEYVLLMRIMGFLAFRQAGYVQTVANCWAVSPNFIYRHQDHKYSMGEYLGIGAMSFNFIFPLIIFLESLSKFFA